MNDPLIPPREEKPRVLDAFLISLIILFFALHDPVGKLLKQVGMPFPGPGTAHSSGASGTFTLIQKVKNNSCTASVAACAVTVSAIGSGHMGVVSAGYGSGAQDTVSSVVCTATGCGAFTRCAACGAFNVAPASNLGTEQAYNLNMTGGGTIVTLTLSAGPTVGWDMEFREYSYSGPSASLDTGNTASDATCTTCAGATLTLGGTQDTIVQLIAPNNSCTAVASPFNTNAEFTTNGDGYADRLNTNAGTAPSWTCASGVAAVGGIALKGN